MSGGQSYAVSGAQSSKPYGDGSRVQHPFHSALGSLEAMVTENTEPASGPLGYDPSGKGNSTSTKCTPKTRWGSEDEGEEVFEG